jgi:hypothetical protein
MLRDDRVSKHEELFEKNMSNFKKLDHFLKRYAQSMSTEAPLKAQRHALEFILPCAPPQPPK